MKGYASINIKRYVPNRHEKWGHDGDGSTRARMRTDQGIVNLFTFPGSEKQRPFTSLEMWIAPHVYHCTLPRHYKDRWLNRIAVSFSWQCAELAKQNNP